ncbi:polymer-forming cytoskeletal protein [Clostridium algidicarnis]|uniref:polymer-forming cytoskeletal protein n=1 Tax=Clostridium algidicarnis TaxID=37659 RepID=UPI001C0E42D4|nr:polymer-forming cytoskeletal protein [Clostridium algidicarnis]MBU3204315.1 polymer-forming cytoskeletal protein [Clostridium algidicarnis]MBU3212601.1 polymer-forming cytoskeletal protein [Clostridium algidicarnis]MBU3223032.1 polymer-forming cytoskeletal protein [Clostridium algidicarnis]
MNESFDKEKKGDIKISGSGSAGGGSYDEVKISGSGKITGDLDCNLLKISGSGKIDGNIKAKDIYTSGSFKSIGNVKCNEFKGSGSSKVMGDMEADEFSCSGSMKVDGNLNGIDMSISGSIGISKRLSGTNLKCTGVLDVEENCEVEEFKSFGAFNIKGLLTADNIAINIGGYCRAKEIGGEKIEIKIGPQKVFNFFGLENILGSLFNNYSGNVLESEIIEGDEIYLECTRAKVVRGNNIFIGKDCEIERVEYKGELTIEDSKAVKESIKIV